jgi:hypothetical protein
LLRSRSRRSRVALLAVGIGLSLAGLAACSNDTQTTADAYRLGCPAIDAAISGSGTAKEATVKGLEVIRDSGQLDPQPQEWLDTAIMALQGSSPSDLPADARKTLVDGCAEHGYPLQNLS